MFIESKDVSMKDPLRYSVAAGDGAQEKGDQDLHGSFMAQNNIILMGI